VPRRRGLLVALLAPDGAGKSTAVAALHASLPPPVHEVYLGLYSRERPVRGALVPGSATLVRLVRQWRGYLEAARHRRRGAIVLLDRYCYDARLREGEGGWLRRARTWVLGHACPAPDVTIVLDAPGEILHRRKPEHPVEELEGRRRGYLDLAARYGWRVVDASQPLTTVHTELEATVLEAVSLRR
jgi:thymidylate kinase